MNSESSSAEVQGAAALERGLVLLDQILEGGPTASLAQIADRIPMPISTAQRLVAVFVRQGLLCRVGPGRYAGGVRMAQWNSHCDWHESLAEAARPLVTALARAVGATVHCGVLEAGMVTYLVKAHGGGQPVLTSEQSQLEAYCSGIGKALLAHQSAELQEAYLAAGPFVALTDRTTTDPDQLRRLFEQILAQGYAVDDAELQPGLYCLAVPVWAAGERVVAAVSISMRSDAPVSLTLLDPLKDCARRLGRRIGAGGA
ncbi:MAG: IclR family transcriptional regulator [Caulobacteraceae bacterium]|nr:IclR family transcriptional regulator [Caulobacteraceae bacterium]